ncbi:MAG: glycosyltransferase family 4 protein [Lachnospiraceae bacterium]|nr:glycosyltransferase family 4 protein [Lachnospiraceae bacterium]
MKQAGKECEAAPKQRAEKECEVDPKQQAESECAATLEHSESSKNPKKKILIITNHSYMLYRFRKELIEELQKNNKVYISMPFVGHEDDFKAMGVHCIETPIDRRGINPITDLSLIKTYNRMLNKLQPNLVITYSIKPNIYAGFLCGLKKIPYYANVQGLGTAFQRKGLAQFVTLLYKLAFRKVEKVFFENTGNAREFQIRKIIPEFKQKILSGAGINLTTYSYKTYPDNDKIHFLYLGRIMKEKGMDELFQVVQRLKEEGEDFVLDLVGFYEDEYKDQVEELEDKGIVKFHGFQEEPRPFYEAADCVVLPSYHEGMSNVNLEAAATGRPIITSNIPGCREALDHKQTGLLCRVKDAESLYKAMKYFLSCSKEKREKMGRLGREKMEREFAKEKVVAETVETLGM